MIILAHCLLHIAFSFYIYLMWCSRMSIKAYKDLDLVIRAAKPDDAQTILQFIKELACFERAEHEVVATVGDIEQSLSAEHATLHGIIAEKAGKAIGFGIYFYNYSTWQGRHGIYLEDLYVTPDHRGKGVGKQLLKYLAKKAVAENCGRFEWSVLDWNQSAIDVYESLGARSKAEWLGYRLSGEALQQFANS